MTGAELNELAESDMTGPKVASNLELGCLDCQNYKHCRSRNGDRGIVSNTTDRGLAGRLHLLIPTWNSVSQGQSITGQSDNDRVKTPPSPKVQVTG